MDSASQVAPTSGSELPFLDGVLERVERELKQREQVGFLYFDVVEFSALTENYGPDVSQRLLQSLSETLNKQRGKLFRDEDLIAVGGPAVDFFVIYLFSPPRRKESFAKSDLKLISNRVLQKSAISSTRRQPSWAWIEKSICVAATPFSNTTPTCRSTVWSTRLAKRRP